MKNTKDIVIVRKEHIEPGIKKYDGRVDENLKKLFTLSGIEVTPYLFADGRVLLLYPNQENGILYASTDILFQKLDLAVD